MLPPSIWMILHVRLEQILFFSSVLRQGHVFGHLFVLEIEKINMEITLLGFPSGTQNSPSNVAALNEFTLSFISVASIFWTTTPLYLILPICSIAASKVKISEISSSLKDSTFIADRISPNSYRRTKII